MYFVTGQYNSEALACLVAFSMQSFKALFDRSSEDYLIHIWESWVLRTLNSRLLTLSVYVVLNQMGVILILVFHRLNQFQIIDSQVSPPTWSLNL